jgi:hypothetical protein
MTYLATRATELEPYDFQSFNFGKNLRRSHSVLEIRYVDHLCSTPRRAAGNLRFDVTEASQYSWFRPPCRPERLTQISPVLKEIPYYFFFPPSG